MEFNMEIENWISVLVISSLYFCLLYELQSVKLKEEKFMKNTVHNLVNFVIIRTFLQNEILNQYR